MADKYNKLEPRVPKEVLYTLIGIVVIAIVLFLLTIPSRQEKLYNEFSANANSDFTEDHPYYEITYKQLVDKIENDEYLFVFIGSPDNSTSQTYIGAFQKYYEELNVSQYVDHIYYYNPTGDDDNFYQLQEDVYEVSTLSTQMLFFINGEVQATFVSQGTSDTQLVNRAAKYFFDDAIAAINTYTAE